MKPEEFEVYVIPPNFMEGGTLFGGLLKTRNTVEAVILGLAVGVPVMHLPFSLTVRVVILCLTALPLVLLALIGVSGMSLSAFIRLFFCFLHNRRILSRDGTQGGKNGKTLLPSWAQQRKSDCEAEDPPLPKSRSRFSVDLKQRSVTQFKTFLQEEEAVQPLNALADYIPIEKIEHGVIYTRDHRYVKVVEVVPVNFLLRSAREQRSIIYSFISYLKIAPVKVQFKALTKRADINRHLDTVHDVTLEYPGQIIKLSAYDKPASLGVTITKRGNAQVMAGQSMRYDLTVANTSNVPLESFFWHDKIPYDVARPTTLTTGTYSARLNYRILYKTNYNATYQVLASNLLTSNNYSFSLNAIPMQAGEVVTDIYFDFGKVPVGFQSVVNPTLSVMVNGNAVNGYQMVNRADVGGKYQGTWQTATASWVTIIRRLWNTPTLPKTGY